MLYAVLTPALDVPVSSSGWCDCGDVSSYKAEGGVLLYDAAQYQTAYLHALDMQSDAVCCDDTGSQSASGFFWLV
jgi:hypothetical protein